MLLSLHRFPGDGVDLPRLGDGSFQLSAFSFQLSALSFELWALSFATTTTTTTTTTTSTANDHTNNNNDNNNSNNRWWGWSSAPQRRRGCRIAHLPLAPECCARTQARRHGGTEARRRGAAPSSKNSRKQDSRVENCGGFSFGGNAPSHKIMLWSSPEISIFSPCESGVRLISVQRFWISEGLTQAESQSYGLEFSGP